MSNESMKKMNLRGLRALSVGGAVCATGAFAATVAPAALSLTLEKFVISCCDPSASLRLASDDVVL